jgi:hypothetical protein
MFLNKTQLSKLQMIGDGKCLLDVKDISRELEE